MDLPSDREVITFITSQVMPQEYSQPLMNPAALAHAVLSMGPLWGVVALWLSR